MKSVLAAVGAMVGCATLVASLVSAADWPQWRGPNRDGKAADFRAPATWPKELAPVWKAELGSTDATPALVGDKLYAFTRQGDQEVVTCLEAASGKTIWQGKSAPGVAVSGPAGSHPGPRSSPAVAAGKVVTLGVSGVLSCFDAETGKSIWRKETARDFPEGWPAFFTASSPIIVDGLCCAQIGGPGKGAVVAFDLASGEVRWKSEGDGPAYASPMVVTLGGTKQVVAQTEKSLVGLAFGDGKALWKIDTPTQRRAQNAVTPVIHGDILIFSGQGTGTRAVRIERAGDGFAAKDVWSNEKISSTFNTPVLKDGKLFGLTDRGNYYCLDAQTGNTLWTDSAQHGERGFGSIVDAGSVFVALTNKSELVAFKPSDAGYAELANIKLSDKPVYAHPVVAGNHIFVADQNALAAFKIE